MNQNIFEELMNTTKTCSLGEITNSLFEVGGQYRRNMQHEKIIDIIYLTPIVNRSEYRTNIFWKK